MRHLFTLLLTFSSTVFADTEPVPMNIGVNMIWEGQHIEKHNLERIREFRQMFPKLSLIHIVDPSYFMRTTDEAMQSQRHIRSTIKAGDTIAMHMFSWKSWLHGARILYRDTPSFWGRARKSTCEPDCGADVPITLYSRSELATMFHHGVKTLEKYGFPTPKAYMVGGWLSNENVRNAASEAGFKYDLSRVPTQLVRDRLRQYPLYGWIEAAWQKTTPFDQPMRYSADGEEMIVFTQSTAAVDYLTADELVEIFKSFQDLQRRAPDNTLTFLVSVHQETAHKYLPRLTNALKQMISHANEQRVALQTLRLGGGQWNEGVSQQVSQLSLSESISRAEQVDQQNERQFMQKLEKYSSQSEVLQRVGRFR